MKTKKRIALEIIIFFSSLLFLAISFSLLSVWNKFKENQINEYSKKIEKLDSRIKLLETNLKYKFIPFENYTAKLLYKLYQEEKIISRKTSFEQFENSDDFLIKGSSWIVTYSGKICSLSLSHKKELLLYKAPYCQS